MNNHGVRSLAAAVAGCALLAAASAYFADVTRYPPSDLVTRAVHASSSAPDSSQPVAYELGDVFEAADRHEVLYPLAYLNIGDRQSRRYAYGGWATYNESADDWSMNYRWGLGQGSTILFGVQTVRPLQLQLRCKSVPLTPGLEQALTLVVNGHEVQRRMISNDWATYTTRVPAEFVQQGANKIELYYAHHLEPSETGGERRKLAVAWDRIDIATIGPLPELGADGGITLPYGSRIDYYLELPAGSRLSYDAARHGGKYASMFVEHGPAGAKPTLVEVRSAGAAVIPLTVAERGLTRVTIRADLPELSGPPTEPLYVHLENPVIRAPEVPAERPKVARPPNIIVYLVDCLRADHLGAYGYEKSPTPRIDGFAEDAVVFTHAVANSPWTRPSVASLFTGLYPTTHTVNGRYSSIPGEVETIAQHLAAYRYHTVAFVTNGNVSEGFGFDKGFDDFHYLSEDRARRTVHQLSDRVNEHVEAWLEVNGQRPRPFFMYIHTTDPHSPYAPPKGRVDAPSEAQQTSTVGSLKWLKAKRDDDVAITGSELERLIELYDSEVRHNDASFGVLIDQLKARALYDEGMVAFLSDHGDEFMEHGSMEHGKTLYAEVIDVPLIIKFPAGRGIGRGRSEVLAQHVDILPTAIEIAGLPPRAGIDGRSLIAPLSVGDSPGRAAFSYFDVDYRIGQSAVRGPWKLINSKVGNQAQTELYHRPKDPGDTVDLARQDEQTVEALKQLLLEHRGTTDGRFDSATVDSVAEGILDALHDTPYFE